MTSAVNGLPKTLPQRSDFPWRKGAQARRTEKIVVGLCLTQFPQRNPYRRVRPIGDEKYPLVDDFGTLSIRTFLVVTVKEAMQNKKAESVKTEQFVLTNFKMAPDLLK